MLNGTENGSYNAPLLQEMPLHACQLKHRTLDRGNIAIGGGVADRKSVV
ncbi:MAG: hypothetical protein PWR21_2082, partial [Methanoculleus sp.]|nr:hypothetical protein [Methanoculleus sp.]